MSNIFIHDKPKLTVYHPETMSYRMKVVSHGRFLMQQALYTGFSSAVQLPAEELHPTAVEPEIATYDTPQEQFPAKYTMITNRAQIAENARRVIQETPTEQTVIQGS